MAFTANEMATAISNSPANMDLANRFERSQFAAYLEESYGADDETAAECLAFLMAGETWYEDGPISYFARDLYELRASLSEAGLGGLNYN